MSSEAHATYFLEEYGSVGDQQLGHTVTQVGDLNGDGYPDIAIGSPGFNALGTGRVFIYFGGPVIHQTPDLELGAGISVWTFGFAVAGGKDLNGDGYPDLLVGANGGAYVFFGGPSMHNVPDLTLSPPAGATAFGLSVALADLNGDGFADCVVGAPGTDPTRDDGHVYAYDGSANPHTSPDLILGEFSHRHSLGFALANAGDVNGDGYDDLLVSQPLPDMNGGGGIGAVDLYFGSASPDSIPDLVFASGGNGGEFGYSVAGVGDLNGDGYPDIAIGAPFFDPPGLPTDMGMVAIYRGGPAMNTDMAAELTGRGSIGENFGYSVAGAGDVNGDGHPDLLVGAPHAAGTEIADGRAALFFGGPILHPTADRVLTHPDGYFGAAVSGAGDVNGDGFADILVGAPGVTTNIQQGSWQGAFVLADGFTTVGASPAPPTLAFLAPRPNPARNAVDLSLTLDRADRLSVEAFDVKGRMVARPIDNELLGPGPVSRAWSLRDLPTGIYWLRARFANRNVTQRLVHLESP